MPPLDPRVTERLMARVVPGLFADDTDDEAHRAQELVYEAAETDDPRARIRMAREALELWPDCADAYNLLAEESARDPAEAAELYRSGVQAGERALGEQVFEEDAGDFWGLLETRPYMRARWGLAQCLWQLGQHEEAVEHARDLLRLNPDDNQGVRQVLAAWLLELQWDDQAGELLDAYADDVFATMAYARALQSFRDEGASERSNRRLAEAVEANAHVPPFLLGRKRLPEELPALLTFGGESEAIEACVALGRAWGRALDWLRRRVAE